MHWPHVHLLGVIAQTANFTQAAQRLNLSKALVSQRLAEFGFTDQRDLDLIREDVRFTLPPELASIAPAPRR